MADCEKARNYIRDLIEENDLGQYVSQEQVEYAVAACCDDLGSQECLNATLTLNSTAGCMVLTKGVCPPCCAVAGGFIGPITGEAIGWAWGAIEDAWSTVKGWFGGGGCDYSPASDKLVAAYSAAMRKIAVGLDTAWSESRNQLGLPSKPALFVIGPGKLLTPIPLTQDSVMSHMGDIIAATWEQALLQNAIRFSKLEGPPHFAYTLKDKDDRMVSPEVDVETTLTPEHYFQFWWENWDCAEANRWREGAQKIASIRMGFVNSAAEHLQLWMSTAIGTEAREADMSRVHKLATAMRDTMRMNLVRAESGGVGVGTVFTVGLLGLGGWICYNYIIANK